MSNNESACNRFWSGEFVWDGRQLLRNTQWIENLDSGDIAELSAAIETLIRDQKQISSLSRTDLDFQRLGKRLERIEHSILSGRGFTLIKGLPAQQWTDEQLTLAYWLIGIFLGTPVSQNADGHLLGHVINTSPEVEAGTRIYRTNRAQPFHSDSCDIVGLLCLQTARTGGESSVASSGAIYNHLLETQPETIQTLHGEFHCDRYGEIPAGKQPSYKVRIFNKLDGQLVCCGMDPDIRSAQRLDEVPDLETQQTRALDSFQQSASELALNMHLERGDIQLVNNHVVVHARTAFEDYDARERRRHLVRLWLSSDKGRRLPEFLEERWGNIEPGSKRGGIFVDGVSPTVPMMPE